MHTIFHPIDRILMTGASQTDEAIFEVKAIQPCPTRCNHEKRAFLILEWNLMARAENVVHAHILHVLWEDDAIVFPFVKSKADQTGRNRDPHMPEMSTVAC